MKVGDLVQLRVIEWDDAGEFYTVNHKGLILSGAYDYGWVEVLFFDGQHQFYDDSDPEWEDFFEVLSES